MDVNIMEENYKEIISLLVEIGGDAKSAKEGVARINGNIPKIIDRVSTNEKDIIELNNTLGKIYDFMRGNKESKEWWGGIRANVVTYMITALIGGGVGCLSSILGFIWFFKK